MPNTIEKPFKPKIRLKMTDGYEFVNDVVQMNKLNTVPISIPTKITKNTNSKLFFITTCSLT